MDDPSFMFVLALAWIGFSIGSLLTAAAVWVVQDAMNELYYQQLDVLNRAKARDKAA